MQEKLIIYLHAHDLEHPSWAVLDAEGNVRQSESHDNALGFSQIAEDKEIIVIVPAEDVLLTSVVLPKMNRTRLAQALPYALEEKLIDDVESLHFAYGEHRADEPLPVAVIAHERMEQWLNLLNAWHVKIDLLVPASFVLPYEENAWHILVADMAIARTELFQGFACDKANLPALLALASAEANQAPQSIHIRNYTKEPFAPLLNTLSTVQEEVQPEQHFIADLAHYAGKTPLLNLLQSRYATKKSKFPRRDKLWKAAIGFVTVWVAILFLYPTVSYFILKQRTHIINAQIVQIYKRQFPQSTNIVAPKLRLQEKLQKLSVQAGENRLLVLLGYVGKGIQVAESVKIKRFDFQNNQLTLELNAGSSEDFSAFTGFLTRQGLNVKQQNANLTGARVNATVLIE